MRDKHQTHEVLKSRDFSFQIRCCSRFSSSVMLHFVDFGKQLRSIRQNDSVTTQNTWLYSSTLSESFKICASPARGTLWGIFSENYKGYFGLACGMVSARTHTHTTILRHSTDVSIHQPPTALPFSTTSAKLSPHSLVTWHLKTETAVFYCIPSTPPSADFPSTHLLLNYLPRITNRTVQ